MTHKRGTAKAYKSVFLRIFSHFCARNTHRNSQKKKTQNAQKCTKRDILHRRMQHPSWRKRICLHDSTCSTTAPQKCSDFDNAETLQFYPKLRAAKRGCFKWGGFPIWTCPSFFVLFCPFPGIFPICAGMVRGFSRFVLFLFLSLLRAPTRNSPERVRDTIWTIPEKSGKHPGLETPRFSFSQLSALQGYF